MAAIYDWAFVVLLCAFNVVLNLSIFMYFIFARKLHLNAPNYEFHFKLAYVRVCVFLGAWFLRPSLALAFMREHFKTPSQDSLC